MNIGPMRHRVAIQEQTTTDKDSVGTPKNVWTTTTTRWASIEPLVGREYFSSQQVNAEVTTKFRFRNQVAILPRMRLVHAGKWYDVIAVMPIETITHELVVMAALLTERPL